MQKRFREAQARVDRAIELHLEIVVEQPQVTVFQASLSDCYVERSRVMVAQKDFEAAAEDLNKALEVRRRLVESHPTKP